MTPVRVLHVVGAMNRGGAETMIMNLYRALDRDRVQFDFLEFNSGVSHYSEEIKSMGGRVLQMEWSQSPVNLRRTIKNLSSFITDNGPFVAVHSHILFATGTVLTAASRAGIDARIAHSHNTNDVDQGLAVEIYRWISRKVINIFATDFAACTTDAGVYLFGKRRFAERGVIIPNAVDTERFFPVMEKEKQRLPNPFRIGSEGIKLVSVARMEPAKNHDFLIDVATELDKRGMIFELIFVGDGALRPGLEAKVKALGLVHKVRFLGVQENVNEIMQFSDALVMPSHFEGLPVVLVEAQAAGLPCIVSENVTREADLGLGLVKYLPIQSPSDWVQKVSDPLPRIPPKEKIRAELSLRGYTVEGALEKLLSLYPLEKSE